MRMITVVTVAAIVAAPFSVQAHENGNTSGQSPGEIRTTTLGGKSVTAVVRPPSRAVGLSRDELLGALKNAQPAPAPDPFR